MKQLPIKIDFKLRARLDDLPPGAFELIAQALSIPNLEKQEAKQQHLWGWQNMPDEIELYEIHNDYLIMPRGFARDLQEGLASLGIKVWWEDNRTFEEVPILQGAIDLKTWQLKAEAEARLRQQGIYKAPAGSGKTVTILGLIGYLGSKSIVIVNTKDIMWQWQERVRDFLGDDYPVGQIGDNEFDVSKGITIATAQTLNSRFDELQGNGFFDEFSLMCLDECHHATADTYNRIVDRFSSRYRLGVSATPDKTGDFALATHVLGPVIHTTHPREVDSLILPEVIRIPTQFVFGFRGTRSRFDRSNYGKMIEALVNNAERNQLIVNQVMANQNHHQLVISKRLAHLDTLADMLEDAGFSDPIYKLTGTESSEERQRVKQAVETEPCVVLSTLADEALDVPRLDRVHLTFPQKNAGLIVQQVGRVERAHPDKEDAIIYDYCDLKIGPLQNQYRTRKLEVYEPRGYKISTQQPKGQMTL